MKPFSVAFFQLNPLFDKLPHIREQMIQKQIFVALLEMERRRAVLVERDEFHAEPVCGGGRWGVWGV